MAKKGEFKPGLFNFYLAQGPHKTTGQPTVGVTVYGGKKSDTLARGMVYSPSKGVHFAFLAQVEIQTEHEFPEKYEYYETTWVKPYDMTTVEKSAQEG